jgi:hypothetical protein
MLREENRRTWRKTFEARERTNNSTQLIYDTKIRNQTWVTVVRGEHAHQYATHASIIVVI